MDNQLVESANRFMYEDENTQKYNTIDKVVAKLGQTPSDESVISFIKANYDMDDEYDVQKVSDIVSFYKLDTEQYFDNEGNLK